MENETDSRAPEPARSGPRHWRLPVFFAAWTLFAALVVWWFLERTGVTNHPGWVVRSGDPSQASLADKFRDWCRLADLNFHGIYPWILLAPYVVWLAARFHLERGRLRVRLPIHLLGCALFAAASSGFSTHVAGPPRGIVIAYTKILGGPSPWELLTNELTLALGTQVAERGELGVGSNSHSVKVTTQTVRLPDGTVKSVRTIFQTNVLDGPNVLLRGGVASHKLPDGFPPELGLGPGAGGGWIGRGPGGAGGWSASALAGSQALAHLLNVLAYGSLAGLAHAVHFYRRYRERERRALLLESHLAQARLQALQAQLHPHFLFNALNAISTLLRRDARAAQEALTSFSELLRLALSQSDRPEVTLREDLEFLARYVEIQQTRLGDRFRFEQAIEPATLDCLVPALLLQPLVENALRHGLELSPHPGTVRVSASEHGSRLLLAVEDNGAGLPAADEPRLTPGIGLANLRARLETLYGSSQSVDLCPHAGGGVVVRIELPARRSTGPGPALPRPGP